MKAAIKFSTTERQNKNGYPIIVTLYHQGKRHKNFIAHSHPKNWDSINQVPIKSHPDYNSLMPLVLEYHAKIKAINLGLVTHADALQQLFKPEAVNQLEFYAAGLGLCDNTPNGKLYKSILNSFNRVYPGIFTTEITKAHATNYMRALLKNNGANGVHTYLRTLNAIYNRLTDTPNPFKGIRPKKVKTKNKALTDADITKLATTLTIKNKFDSYNDNETVNYWRYYWLLMFYLGGIDFIDLCQLRYDKHVNDGRVQFFRNKGGTAAYINNRILPPAAEILKRFDCWPYLVPAYKYKNHNDNLKRVNKKAKEAAQDLQLTKEPLTKSARYTFITRAQQILIDERITMELVGHTQYNIHSIYTDAFTVAVRDAAHKKIIDLGKN